MNTFKEPGLLACNGGLLAPSFPLVIVPLNSFPIFQLLITQR